MKTITKCRAMAAGRIFDKIDGDPDVTVISGEQAYKILKQKGAAL